jgi:hypothetical protein
VARYLSTVCGFGKVETPLWRKEFCTYW